MQEYSRLSNLSLLQVFVSTSEHDIGDTITQNLVSFLKQFLCSFIVVVQVLTHSNELRTLSREYKCFHFTI